MLANRPERCVRRLPAAGLLALGLLACASSPAQDVKGGAKGSLPDFIPAGYDDWKFAVQLTLFHIAS